VEAISKPEINKEIYLDAYFKRINYNGTPSVNLETLQALHLLHPQAIPFENLDPLAGKPVLIDPASLKRKLIDGQRGGYCFEHNLLLKHVLDAIGFKTWGLGGRVVWGRTDDTLPSLTHALLLIDLDGVRYIADVGFGGMTFTAPLLLELNVEQSTPHEIYRLIELDATTYLVQVKLHNDWKSMYRFDLYVRYPIDYEMANYYTYSYPTSLFVRDLMISILGADSHCNLINNRMTIYKAGTGIKEEKEISSAKELRAVVQNQFGINLCDTKSNDSTNEFDAVLARFAP
jgi:N-hydroxyarylamine O-acetyltransferase